MSPHKVVRFRPRLIRLQFGLRAYLVVVSVFCVWLAFHVRAYDRQKHAVELIQKYGGWIRYSYEVKDGKYDPNSKPWVATFARQLLGDDFFYPVVEVNFVYSEDSGKRSDNANVQAAPLECLADLPKLTGLFLHNTQANDTNLKHVAKLNRLERFFAWDAKDVTDIGVQHLRSLRNLTYVHISDSQITDLSLSVLAGLPKLEGLSLQFNRFTDAGVVQLRNLKHLKSLWVCGKQNRTNDITDASVEFLLQLPDLSSVGVQNTKVTSEFSSKLTSKFPKCIVSR